MVAGWDRTVLFGQSELNTLIRLLLIEFSFFYLASSHRNAAPVAGGGGGRYADRGLNASSLLSQ